MMSKDCRNMLIDCICLMDPYCNKSVLELKTDEEIQKIFELTRKMQLEETGIEMGG